MDELLIRMILADRYRRAEAGRLVASCRRNQPPRQRLGDQMRRLRERMGRSRSVAHTAPPATVKVLGPDAKPRLS